MFKFELGQKVYFLYRNNIASSEIRDRRLFEAKEYKNINYKLSYPYDKEEFDETNLFTSGKELLTSLADKQNLKIEFKEE